MLIDINCDMGEGFGRYSLGRDAELMPLISSANLACGFHAGDPKAMTKALELCRRHGVSPGAHPGYADLRGFGRRPMRVPFDELRADIIYQIGALGALAKASGLALTHVKPHGALYNTAAADTDTGLALVEAVAACDASLILVTLAGPAGERLRGQARAAGLRVAAEAFADRTYQPDGTLTPRQRPDAMTATPEAAVEQCLRIIETGAVRATDGGEVPLEAQTICLHGDGPDALDIARLLDSALARRGIRRAPLEAPSP